MGLPERIDAIRSATSDQCSVERWIEASLEAAEQNFMNALVGGELSRWQAIGTPNALSDKADVDSIVNVVLAVRNELCPDCPAQANCPTERVMKVLQAAPLRRGAQIVLDGYFQQ